MEAMPFTLFPFYLCHHSPYEVAQASMRTRSRTIVDDCLLGYVNQNQIERRALQAFEGTPIPQFVLTAEAAAVDQLDSHWADYLTSR